MPDYSLCANEECKKKTECCRYLGVPSQFQSYVRVTGEGPCEVFWDVKEGAPFKLKMHCHRCDKFVGFEQKMGGKICKECRVILREVEK